MMNAMSNVDSVSVEMACYNEICDKMQNKKVLRNVSFSVSSQTFSV